MRATAEEWWYVLEDGHTRAYLMRKADPPAVFEHQGRRFKLVSLNQTVKVAAYLEVERT